MFFSFHIWNWCSIKENDNNRTSESITLMLLHFECNLQDQPDVKQRWMLDRLVDSQWCSKCLFERKSCVISSRTNAGLLDNYPKTPKLESKKRATNLLGILIDLGRSSVGKYESFYNPWISWMFPDATYSVLRCKGNHAFRLSFGQGNVLLPYIVHSLSDAKIFVHKRKTFAVTPNPSGRSFVLYTITPWCISAPSVIRLTPDFNILLPYKNCCSACCLTHTLH